MKYDVQEQGRVVVLALEGNILGGPDGTKLHDRLHELKDAGKRHVVVDLSGVRFMNSSGLGMLISAMTTMRNAGGDFRLAGMGAGIRSLLVITRLDTVFKHYESVDEAVRSYEEDPPAPA
jgi:anti-sigma B factor antagonist